MAASVPRRSTVAAAPRRPVAVGAISGSRANGSPSAASGSAPASPDVDDVDDVETPWPTGASLSSGLQELAGGAKEEESEKECAFRQGFSRDALEDAGSTVTPCLVRLSRP